MTKTFNQMVNEAMGEVPTVSAAEARRRLQKDPRTLVVDVRDAADINSTSSRCAEYFARYKANLI